MFPQNDWSNLDVSTASPDPSSSAMITTAQGVIGSSTGMASILQAGELESVADIAPTQKYDYIRFIPYD